MNPQADNDTDTLKRRLSQLPPTRPDGQLNVPARPSGVHDFDDSAFEPVDSPQPQVARPIPVAPQRPPVQSPVTSPAAPAPMPQRMAAPATPPPRPRTMEPVMAAQQVVPRQPAQPAAPLYTPMPPAATPPVAQTTPQQPASVPMQPAQPPKIPPMPVAAVEHASAPTPTFNPSSPPAAAASPVAYQPATPHLEQALIERIDETPQQNSKDIEGLIEHNHRLHRLKSFASFLVFCAGVVVAAFLINQFIFQSYYVDGTSMTPTLQNDDRLIIDKVERTFAGLQGKPYIPERGQVVVLDSSIVGFNGREEQLIKRVIGLPGDTVSIRDGTVTIKNSLNPDGFNVDRQLGLNLQATYVESPQEWTITDNQVFVMGDNRAENGSYDSRAFGPIESEKIVGRLWARILPFEKAQVF